MAPVAPSLAYKSPLHKMTQTTPTCLWNDSASIEELTYSIEHGAVGATCNPSIAVSVLKKELAVWKPRILELAAAEPELTEDGLAWRIVEEISANAARLLLPIFERTKGHNGRLSIQTDPRNYRNTAAMLEQAIRFSQLAPNMIVKIAATHAGIPAIEEATYRGISINATVSFTLPQAIAVAEAVERGLKRREAEGLDISSMGPVARSWSAASTTGSRCSTTSTISPSILAIWSGPELLSSRRLTKSIKPAAIVCACSRRPFAITCTGANSSAATSSSRRPASGKNATTRATSKSSIASTRLSIRALLKRCSEVPRLRARL